MWRWLAHVLILVTIVASAVGASHLDESNAPPAAPNVAEETQSAAKPPPVSQIEARADFAAGIERWRSLSVTAAATARAATGINIDSDLLLALVAVESGGEPGARSAAGAVGLVQVEPTTFGDLQERYRVLLGQGRLEEPSTNLLAGALYLAECARLLHADLTDPAELNLVLDAYNVGPRAVAEWAATGTWLDGTEVESSLPVETVEHGARIASAYQPAQSNLSNAQIASVG